jgi:hypothetical protein
MRLTTLESLPIDPASSLWVKSNRGHMEAFMVKLDQGLLSEAQQVTTRANAHGIQIMIIAYEQAVDFYNRGYASHRE